MTFHVNFQNVWMHSISNLCLQQRKCTQFFKFFIEKIEI